MFKKITALMIVIFMMMTFTAGCSGSEDKVDTSGILIKDMGSASEAASR